MPFRRGQPVVIGSHLGPESDPVVAAGMAIARALDGPAILVHAESPAPLLFGAPGGGLVPAPSGSGPRSDEIRTALASQAARCSGGESTAEVEASSGPADMVLARIARERGAGLIVVGPPRRPELGTTADRLLRRDDVPVLIVKKGDRLPPATALAAVDLSPASERALALGVRLIARLAAGPCSIELLFALHPQELEGSIHFRPDRLKAFACEELDRLARRAAPLAAQTFERRLEVGDAREAILAQAERRQADLILLGTHGRGGLERWILGSVASTVLRRAETNVLVIPSHLSPDASLPKGER